MRRRDKLWIEKWKSELDERIPELDGRVKSLPIPESAPEARAATPLEKIKALLSKTRVRAAIGALAMLAVIICVVIFAVPDADGTVEFITVEVNPCVMFICDGEGRITNIISENSDADVILSNDDFVRSVIGKSAEDALTEYIDTCSKLGYLDLSGDAIRLGGADGVKLDGVRSALENYFKEKGIYIAVALKSYSDGETDELLAASQSGTVLYSSRVADAADAEEMTEKYKEEILAGSFRSLLCRIATEVSDKYASALEAVNGMTALNSQIRDSGDNPAIMLRDYWSVNKYYSDRSEFSDSFAELMEQMDAAVELYYQATGRRPESAAELFVFGGFYSEELCGVLERVAQGLSFDGFDRYADEIFSVLETFGYDTARLKAAMALPTTYEEFVGKAAEVFDMIYSDRLNGFSAVYAERREAISDTDYAAYISDMTACYGSVEEYFEFLNK